MTTLAKVVQALQKEHDRLTRELKGISAALSAFGEAYGRNRASRTLSPAGRARIAAAQRARWAKVKGSATKTNVVTMPKRRKLSAAARKKIAAAQRARWAKAKVSKKKAS